MDAYLVPWISHRSFRPKRIPRDPLVTNHREAMTPIPHLTVQDVHCRLVGPLMEVWKTRTNGLLYGGISGAMTSEN